MRNASSLSSSSIAMSAAGRLLLAVLLACCLQASLEMVLAEDSSLSKTGGDPQMDVEMSKRDWNRNLNMWGKRGWNNIHGGWGLKRSIPSSWDDQLTYSSPPLAEKRKWQNLQGGWGKRLAPEDETAIQQLASLLDQERLNEQPHYIEYNNEQDYEPNDDEKRDWRPGQFSQGWGKRNNKWEKFRGSWGKRDPAWSNLKGIWGKRSDLDQNSK